MCPMAAETLSLPAHHRVRRQAFFPLGILIVAHHHRIGTDHDQGFPLVSPHHGQRDPEPAVASGYSRTLRLALVDSKLLAEGEVLQDNRRMTFSKQPNQAKPNPGGS